MDKLARFRRPVFLFRADHFVKTFELETLKMRLNDAELHAWICISAFSAPCAR